MANRQPVSVDEASYRATRLFRSRGGRQKGYWVYLDADLLKRAGMDPTRDIEAMRYAQQERTERADGSVRVRGRVILNLAYVTVTEGTP